ncbi:hypothetical protein [Shewanella psychrotolerans]|uniref:hypothetical protein n=1 Tax=Shewanella psychrotolerans TaxID=2864206 RepID=UPI001C657A6F|nr:hypothetical protein [Shewanella psychrotolerans]QYK01300.1 hypothetical protein K0I62_18415 [Shewanella psychrotolerans]
MRIAIAIDSLAGGGAEKVMLTLAKEFTALGHDSHFLSDVNRFWNLATAVTKLSHKIKEIESKIGRFDLFSSNLDKANCLMAKTGGAPIVLMA